MKKSIIGILIYLIGFAFAYNIAKEGIKSHNKDLGKKDTLRDKVFVSCISVGSWCTVIAVPLADIILNIDGSKEINW